MSKIVVLLLSGLALSFESHASDWEGKWKLVRKGSSAGASIKRRAGGNWLHGRRTFDLSKFRPDLTSSEWVIELFDHRKGHPATIKLKGADSPAVRECLDRGGWIDCPLRDPRP